MEEILKKKVLISVSDKDGIIELAKGLISYNYEILATGNTAKLLIDNGINCVEISDYTGFPEIFSGRVKTLHPKIFGGILFRRNNKEDIVEANQNEIYPIDIVCVNLYPFAKVVNRDDVDVETKIENIDIGGPSLIRAAAKNFKYISVLTNSNQYTSFLDDLKNENVNEETRKKLASEAFSHTAYYDKLISEYFEKELLNENLNIRINLPLHSGLRYGENPHQKAFLFGNFYKHYELLHGKELSYNNIIDLVAASNLANELDINGCAIIKHTNPCGAAIGNDALDAYEKALSCDPVSAFGGIVAFNVPVDAVVAEKLNEIFTEVIIAPSYTDEALEVLQKKKNRRILKFLLNTNLSDNQYRNIPGGIIMQENDNSKFPDDYKVVTKKNISEDELKDLKFAWTVCKHTKSNAIVFCKDQKAIGVGAGQMSRVDSSRIAVSKAKQHGHSLINAVAASDAFFPFADGVEEIAESGVTAIVQPGGSVRDDEVIEAANIKNISMIFTGIRNFKH
ncbi:MAG: bifunctional phosphoribosylaminoimidazolecarboxamide formyltransferase/IMP cyclohydrolase [Ignavibacteriales bacterium]|nr:bifunctional phosphoribosylaminoimidazolecarboxamide formyltransferase/IMP cyclohydrolase [Ignavibacteriales bacterium]MCB9218708.1 bifunctional phosphoribosylaminoimidazolecarboxamide formyltransferase/IMP cyclohydrolase [Ignavibacteriales bacterium]